MIRQVVKLECPLFSFTFLGILTILLTGDDTRSNRPRPPKSALPEDEGVHIKKIYMLGSLMVEQDIPNILI